MITRDRSHVYRNDEGEIYISTTQHLFIAGLVDFSMVRQEDLDYAALRGTYVHDALKLHMWSDLDIESLDESYKGYVQAGILFLKENMIDVWGTEEIVFDDGIRTAGEYDLIGSVDGKDWTVYEFKTPATLPATTGLQLEGYKFLLKGADAPIRYLELKKKAVLLRPNGTYRIHEYKDNLLSWFRAIVKSNWSALNAGIIPIGAKSNQKVYALCEKIIKGG